MNVTVLLFASIKDRLRQGRLEIEIDPDATVGSLRAQLADQYPALKPLLPLALAAVNREFAFPEQPLKDGDEVAFFPPVSGGAAQAYPTILRLAPGPLNPDELVQAITLPTTGAVCTFTGIVRGLTEQSDNAANPRQTTRLEYDAYIPMAEAKLGQIAAEIRARWPSVEGLVIAQRLGPLAPGEIATCIACAAAHRDSGVFDAARYGIDRLKEIVPVWKKEIGPQGEAWVEEENIRV